MTGFTPACLPEEMVTLTEPPTSVRLSTLGSVLFGYSLTVPLTVTNSPMATPDDVLPVPGV